MHATAITAEVPQPTEAPTPSVPNAPVSPAVPDPRTPAAPEEPATVPAPVEPATPAVPEPGPDKEPSRIRRSATSAQPPRR